jgi:hypothetical protein
MCLTVTRDRGTVTARVPVIGGNFNVFTSMVTRIGHEPEVPAAPRLLLPVPGTRHIPPRRPASDREAIQLQLRLGGRFRPTQSPLRAARESR